MAERKEYSGFGKNLLILEPDNLYLQLMLHHLKSIQKYNVDVVNSLEEAFQSKTVPDILILNVDPTQTRIELMRDNLEFSIMMKQVSQLDYPLTFYHERFHSLIRENAEWAITMTRNKFSNSHLLLLTAEPNYVRNTALDKMFGCAVIEKSSNVSESFYRSLDELARIYSQLGSFSPIETVIN